MGGDRYLANRISSLFKKKVYSENASSRLPAHAKNLNITISKANTDNLVYPAQLVAGTAQSVGMHRDHNEDALFCLTFGLADGKTHDEFGLFIIADGMGGHRNGEVASSVTCRVISRLILQKIADSAEIEVGGFSVEEWQLTLQQSIAESQKAVLQSAPGGGTTVTAAIWTGGKVIIAHVGDSRAYFALPEGKLEKITRDHSLVQRLIDLNEISESEAESHPQKNVLLRAIGQPDPLTPDLITLSVPPGSKLMLCSDGLWGVVDEITMTNIVLQEKDATKACERLVTAANQNGGPDNISVILAGLKG